MVELRQGYSNPDLLVETHWLEEHLGDEDLRIVDCDIRDAYCKGHIVGAVGVRDHYWKNPYDPIHLMTPEQFTREMSAMGIGDDTLVIAYDSSSMGQYAGRLWWTLNYYGHDNVKILNGGCKRWLHEGRPFNITESSYPPKTFTPRIRADLLATGDYVKGVLGRKDVVLLDVREDHEYAGTRPQRSDARQFRLMAITPALNVYGHIPGSVHLEAKYVLPVEPWTYRLADELLEMFCEAGVSPDKEIIPYCYGGTRSALGLFGLKLLGYERVRLFDGGWNEWGLRDDVPVEK